MNSKEKRPLNEHFHSCLVVFIHLLESDLLKLSVFIQILK